MIYAFTSINAAYLPNARILARSVKVHHPEWTFVLLLSDTTPEGVNWAEEPFDEVFFADQLPVKDFRSWCFQYSVIELCTAVKGIMAEVLLDRADAAAVVYLDPDTAVFSRLVELENLLPSAGFVLTPHLTDAETTTEGISSHEIAALKHGTFNLGFFAVSQTAAGRTALRWWSERLLEYSFIDFNSGLFTDQKWANLMPYLFDNVAVMRDRNYNVATWNMRGRGIERSGTDYLVAGNIPLRFYHFSGFGHDFAWAKRELEIFGTEGDATLDLWDWYRSQYARSLKGSEHRWAWGFYRNGERILDAHRRRFRDHPAARLIVDPFSNEMHRLLSAQD